MPLKPEKYAPKTSFIQLFKYAKIFLFLCFNNFVIIFRLSLLVFIVVLINLEF